MAGGYRVGPVKSESDYYLEGETKGDTVFDGGDWSEDRPTGVYTPDGMMMYRTKRSIGFDIT